MKKLIYRTLETLGVAALLMVPAIYAQVKVDVPFDFQVGDEKMPAGEYYLAPAAQGSPVITITNEQTRTARMTPVTIPLHAAKPLEKGKLVFNRYEDRYFLSQVWAASRSNGHALRKSKAEREIARVTRSGSSLVAVKAR